MPESLRKNVRRLFFPGERLKFPENLRNIGAKIFFFLDHLRIVYGPWLQAFLSLASGGYILGRAVLVLGFRLCPWPWPRALCSRLHL